MGPILKHAPKEISLCICYMLSIILSYIYNYIQGHIAEVIPYRFRGSSLINMLLSHSKLIKGVIYLCSLLTIRISGIIEECYLIKMLSS